MSFYLMALASIICIGIWLYHRKSVLFAMAAAVTVITLLDGLYQNVNEQYMVCFLLLQAILAFSGRARE